MKTLKPQILGLAITLMAAFQVSAQDSTAIADKKEEAVKVQRHTVMDQFAPEIIQTAEERKQRKIAHLAEIELKKKALDTMDISRRKKRKLLADLDKTPYSDRLNRAMADVKFDDEEEIIKD